MWNYIVFIFTVLASQAWTIHSQCQEVNGTSGVVSDSYNAYGYNIIKRCWRIAVPMGHLINASVELPQFSTEDKRNCSNAYVEIKLQNLVGSRFCGFDNGTQSFFAGNDTFLEINFYVNSGKYANNVPFSFRIKYFMRPSILGVKGISNARENAINWLKRRHNFFWGWKEETPRAVTALYLSGGAVFNGTVREEMMAKQAELRTALALTWNIVSIEKLSRFINGLLATCLNPRQFYGHDLVDKLKNQMTESSANFTHPIAYLALCNANEPWPPRAPYDLSFVFNSRSDYRFIREIQAFAVMAVSCGYTRPYVYGETEEDFLKPLFLEAVKRMKDNQKPDGSFGNPYTTALFTQALIGCGLEFDDDWRMSEAIQYLIKEMNGSSVNFLTAYATLPLLNGKTLVNISYVDCANNPRSIGEDPESQLKDNRGPKMRVKYSLYIGEQKDVIHTISLRVPKNSSALTVMELAAIQDKKYEFKTEVVYNKKHIYEIAGIPNDPEEGMFWLMYLQPKSQGGISRLTISPEQYTLQDEDHLIMWYDVADIR